MIHPSAIISDQSSIDPSVFIGPYVVIEGSVSIGRGCRIQSHAVLRGPMTVGQNNHIHSHAVLGGSPQDLKYQEEDTTLSIGNNNTIREFVTINRGTIQGQGQTRLGDHNLIMAYSHIAHDCRIGNHCILANGSTLAGHVWLEDNVTIGGLSAVHQRVRIGRLAMVAGGSMVSQDIPPFMLAQGDRASIRSLNFVGLRRFGLTPEDLRLLKKIFRIFQSHTAQKNRLSALQPHVNQPVAQEILSHLASTTRGICSFNTV